MTAFNFLFHRENRMDIEKAQIELQEDQRPLSPNMTSTGAGGCSSECSCTLFHGPQHRTLAVASIICGCTPLGIVSLVNSVQAREALPHSPEKSKQYSRTAKKFGILSIMVWLLFLILLPVLVVLISFLLTLKD